jgi:hypothetical protein
MKSFSFFRHSTLALLAALVSAAWAADAAPRGGVDASPSLRTPPTASGPLGPGGFLSRWLVLEPIPGDGRVTDSAVRAAVQKEYFPGQLSVLPRAGDKVTINGADYVWHAIEANRHNIHLYHFAWYLGKPTSNVVFFGMTIVESPEEISGVRLAVGSNAGSVWWLNGQEVVGIYGDRQTAIDDGVSHKLTLKKGPNIVRFLVVQNAGMVDCCARFLDANDQPLTRLTQTLTPSLP